MGTCYTIAVCPLNNDMNAPLNCIPVRPHAGPIDDDHPEDSPLGPSPFKNRILELTPRFSTIWRFVKLAGVSGHLRRRVPRAR
jgi:hypothetical protein